MDPFQTRGFLGSTPRWGTMYVWMTVETTRHAVEKARWATLCGAQRAEGRNYLLPIDADRTCPDCERLVDRAYHQHD